MKGFKELDRILRGEQSKPDEKPSIFPLLVANILLAAFYGVCMGIYGLSSRGEQPEYRQMLADAFKVPLLFVLTLFVTFPSLYVFNALVGSRLKLMDLARLLTAALGVLVALLAAFGPIVGFFSVTTNNYPFVVLLNVAVFTISAAFGLAYLLRSLNRLLPKELPKYTPPARATRVTTYIDQITEKPPEEEPVTAPVEVEPKPDLIPPPSPRSARFVITVWLIVFALVGAQMSWVLRPFIGSPDVEFTWFRPRGSSFFEAVAKAVRMLFN
jgi:hypothetical protein